MRCKTQKKMIQQQQAENSHLKQELHNYPRLQAACIRQRRQLEKQYEKIQEITTEHSYMEELIEDNMKEMEELTTLNNILKSEQQQVVKDFKKQHRMELERIRLEASVKIFELETRLIKGKKVVY